MKKEDIELLEENGWIVVCESPFEIKDTEGEGEASGSAAELILASYKYLL